MADIPSADRLVSGEGGFPPVEGGAVRPQPSDGLRQLPLSPVEVLPEMVERSLTEGMHEDATQEAAGGPGAPSSCCRAGGEALVEVGSFQLA
ncbi:hypothetical protein Dimus_039801 [Dionaea muscipula]